MTASLPKAAAIINPVSGVSTRRKDLRRLTELARRTFAQVNVQAEIVFSERAGHACELAADFARRGFSPIIAWGGDGTVNEVASALAFQSSVMGIVPTGSGNGLARELGISLRPERAIDTAARGIDRSIDVGELGGRLFVNLAGVGLGASVVSSFNRLAGRGLRRYVQATLSTVFSHEAETYTITVEGRSREHQALIVELANGRQYGNGAVIAPHARLDDGLLDLVVVEPLGPLRVLIGAWRLFNGTIDREPGVSTRPASRVTISAARPIRFHVDGELAQGSRSLSAAVHAGALRVRVPGT
ncbi:MAG: diacylglycerol kinase family lipid kinase [Vicinamibacterales bacterium]|jgi:YegS/Rv2252/BmrU family lipid kinase|nr:diacylglycerol kinase family lipid kinase [Vicinamibacterales bacterium]HJN46778.1 diacylglycerol kinase family protein [Vicinamibacterales bacterium]|tara:strand:- start:2241 stop:3143 length:903 start_codon:yes stop_codon:yes gene_type:complete